jgi:hypothetical protein
MARPMEERRGRQQVGVSTRVGDNLNANDLECTCCDPKNPLVLRHDLGTLSDGSAEYALCVLHSPQVVVYRNRGDGVYVQAAGLSLNARGEIVNAAGQTVARVRQDDVQRLTTVDDEEPPPPSRGGGGGGINDSPGGSYAPRTTHVDLTQDDFYLISPD